MSAESSCLPSAETDANIEFLDYYPHGAAAKLFDCTDPEVLLDGPAGTGKTRAVLHKIDEFCATYPGARCLICRNTRTSMTESVLVTLERDVFWPSHPAMSGDATRANRHSYDYPNGSTIVVGGLDKAEKLFSTEWDLVYVAEATEISEDDWEKFARAMRAGKGPYHQRIADCNPAAPGHWLNQRALAGKMTRLVSRHADNPSITPQYLEALRSLSGHRRARLYEGRWVAAEGCVFPEFGDQNVSEPFLGGWPADWPCWLGYDPGYDHPCAVVAYGLGPTGQPYIFDCVHRSGMSLDDVGRAIIAMCKGRQVQQVYADPRAAWSRTQFSSGKSIAEYLREKFLIELQPWPAASGGGLQQQVELVRQLLLDVDKPLKVWDTCQPVIDEFQSWAYKRSADGSIPAGDDAYEDRNNDALDAIRGIVATRPQFEQSPPAEAEDGWRRR